MKKILAFMLAILMLLCTMAFAEDAQPAEAVDDADFDFDFADDGYDGEWIELTDLGIEFCLPDGWTENDPGDAVYCAAEKLDGSASLVIRLEADDVTDIIAWGETNLDSYEVEEANFYDTLVVEEPGAITVRFLTDGGKLIAFDFTRKDADALTRDWAIRIVSSACELWDDDVFIEDGDDGDFDFGEAFEEDLEEDGN